MLSMIMAAVVGAVVGAGAHAGVVLRYRLTMPPVLLVLAAVVIAAGLLEISAWLSPEGERRFWAGLTSATVATVVVNLAWAVTTSNARALKRSSRMCA